MLGAPPAGDPELPDDGDEGPELPEDVDGCPPLLPGLDGADEGDEDGAGMGLGMPLGNELDVVVRQPAVRTEPANTSNAFDQWECNCMESLVIQAGCPADPRLAEGTAPDVPTAWMLAARSGSILSAIPHRPPRQHWQPAHSLEAPGRRPPGTNAAGR